MCARASQGPDEPVHWACMDVLTATKVMTFRVLVAKDAYIKDRLIWITGWLLAAVCAALAFMRIQSRFMLFRTQEGWWAAKGPPHSE